MDELVSLCLVEEDRRPSDFRNTVGPNKPLVGFGRLFKGQN